jgi:alpha-D-ribose 1-methylphosphonate 5-phosphate C-P lyase
MTNDWVLRVDGLGRTYGSRGPRQAEIVAARDVTFRVAPGEALGIIGESGSGKSTVLRCIAGDEQPTAGSVWLAAGERAPVELTTLPPAARRALRIDTVALVHQDPAQGLRLDLTAGGNIAERLTAAGWRNFAAIRRRAAELLDRVEVPLSRMDDLVRTFSGGMRQRVQLAAALALRPPLVLLDEPTTGLDASVAAGVLDLIRDLLEEWQMAAVVVSHDMSVVELLTRRSLVMHHGVVVEAGLTDQLLEDPQDAYTQRLVAAARG